MQKRMGDDAGFSMVEIVIAMLLFALLSVAVIPLIMTITVLTVQNRDSETARSAVSADIAALRERYPSDPAISAPALCSQLDDEGFTATPTDIGHGLRVTRNAEACPATFPAAIGVHYEVSRASDGVIVESFDTSIRVTQ